MTRLRTRFTIVQRSDIKLWKAPGLMVVQTIGSLVSKLRSIVNISQAPFYPLYHQAVIAEVLFNCENTWNFLHKSIRALLARESTSGITLSL